MVSSKPPPERRLQGQSTAAEEHNVTQARRVQELSFAFVLGFLALGFVPIVYRRLIPRLFRDAHGDRDSIEEERREELSPYSAFEVA